jgi:hypothetical protein
MFGGVHKANCLLQRGQLDLFQSEDTTAGAIAWAAGDCAKR